MDITNRTVLIGFEPTGTVASLAGNQLILHQGTRFHAQRLLVDGADVGESILLQKQQAPVPSGAVSACNIAPASFDPASSLNSSAGPVPVAKGGTGIVVATTGALLAGAGTAPVSHSGGVSFADGALTTPSIHVGSWRFAASNHSSGRKSLFASDSASGANVDLLLASQRPLPPPALAVVSSSQGQITVQANAADPLVRVIHFDWRPAPSQPRTPAQLARSPSRSVIVAPDGTARYTASGMTLGQYYDFRAAAEDGRGNVSPVAEATALAA
jgi:hypothetical protein